MPPKSLVTNNSYCLLCAHYCLVSNSHVILQLFITSVLQGNYKCKYVSLEIFAFVNHPSPTLVILRVLSLAPHASPGFGSSD